MRLLLDSHVALWWLADDERLGPRCRAHIGDADEAIVSAVTPWELGIKRALGKVDFPGGLVKTLEETGFSFLPITATHAERAPALPVHHRDPFDRMLVAQAQMEQLVLVSADRSLHPYEVDLIDAGL